MASDASIGEWLRLVYPGETAGGNHAAQPALAAQWLLDDPGLLGTDPYLACAAGDIGVLRRTLAEDASWVNRSGGDLNLPPLLAVTHSSLCRLPQWQEQLVTCAKLLLAQGANPDQSIGSRWPPHSMASPSTDTRLTALYGAVGQNFHLEMTQVLLSAGADPDDGECLYHSLENPAITRLLLEAGVPIGPNNALYHAFDLADPTALMVLLQFGADANQPALGEPTSWFGAPLLWAIRRRVSMAHFEALLSAGADTRAHTPDGVSAFQLARRYGLPEVARLLVRWGASDQPGSTKEQFLGACGCALESEARALLHRQPNLLKDLTPKERGLLPELLAAGTQEGGKLMVRLGWPLDARGGDWNATALNIAVFQGDAPLARFLLEQGASWTEGHGYAGNVVGTLSWACRNRPTPQGDWPACAKVLLEYGMPPGQRDPTRPGQLQIDGHSQPFTEEVIQVLLAQ
jgi:ankyrin repeat protein